MKQRPCWAVLLPKRKSYDTELEIVSGTKAHDAILEFEPGSESSGEQELAQAASRRAKLPAYVLWLDEDYPRVSVYANGKYAGDINAWPDAVARQLGCTFPTCDRGRGKIDLTPHKAPAAKKGEQRIGRWTVREWKHMIAHDRDWSILLDGVGEDFARHVLAALDDKKPDTRFVACNLLDAIGYIGDSEFGLGKLVGSTVERLRVVQERDPAKEVRAAAKAAADALASSIEEYAVRDEFPWLLNFDSTKVKQALAALDDNRAAVRKRATMWWWNAHGLRKATFKKVETKLVAMHAAANDHDERETIMVALAGMRAKHQWR